MRRREGRVLKGRRGHARVVVMTITERERDAVRREFGADHLVESRVRGLACWTPDDPGADRFGVLVSQATTRSNMPGAESTRLLIEDWQPEVLIVVGTAGAIARERADGSLSGPEVGDIVCIEYVHYAEYAKYDSGRREPRYFPLQHPDGLLMASEVRALEASHDWHLGIPPRPSGDTRKPEVHPGELVSVEVVAGDGGAAGQQALLSGFDHAIAVDMESAGIARAMHTASSDVNYRPTWLGIRGVSDRTAAASTSVEELLAGNNEERQAWTPYAAAVAARFAHRLVESLVRYERHPSKDPGAPGWVSRQFAVGRAEDD